MRIEEIKTSAFEQLSMIQGEAHLKQVLDYLTAIAVFEKEGKQMTAIFDKTVVNFGALLEKLAQ